MTKVTPPEMINPKMRGEDHGSGCPPGQILAKPHCPDLVVKRHTPRNSQEEQDEAGYK